MTVEIYSKPNCPLCEDAREILERVRTRVEFNLVEIDITADPVGGPAAALTRMAHRLLISCPGWEPWYPRVGNPEG
jgi:hypothetical protein